MALGRQKLGPMNAQAVGSPGTPEVLLKLYDIRRCLDEQEYPGYPYTLVVLLDLQNKVGIINYRKYDLDDFVRELAYHVVTYGLSCKDCDSGDWLHNPTMGSVEDVIKDGYDGIEFDNARILQLWYALRIAANQHKDERVYMVGTIDEAEEYLTFHVLVDPTDDEVTHFVNEFTTGDPNTPYEFASEDEE